MKNSNYLNAMKRTTNNVNWAFNIIDSAHTYLVEQINVDKNSEGKTSQLITLFEASTTNSFQNFYCMGYLSDSNLY